MSTKVDLKSSKTRYAVDVISEMSTEVDDGILILYSTVETVGKMSTSVNSGTKHIPTVDTMSEMSTMVD